MGEAVFLFIAVAVAITGTVLYLKHGAGWVTPLEAQIKADLTGIVTGFEARISHLEYTATGGLLGKPANTPAPTPPSPTKNAPPAA